jgi:hypothetical protein
MENLMFDLSVWWQLDKSFSSPLTVLGAIIMSSMTLIAYLVAGIIIALRKFKIFLIYNFK